MGLHTPPHRTHYLPLRHSNRPHRHTGHPPHRSIPHRHSHLHQEPEVAESGGLEQEQEQQLFSCAKLEQQQFFSWLLSAASWQVWKAVASQVPMWWLQLIDHRVNLEAISH